jgi:hypothetical protein
LGQVHRSVALLCLLLSCGTSESAPPAESTCKPFAKSPPLALRTVPIAPDTPRTDLLTNSIAANGVSYQTRWSESAVAIVRTENGGFFDLASFPIAVPFDAAIPLALDGNGHLLVGTPGILYSLDANVPSAPVTLAEGFVAPRSLFVDTVTKDIWLVDREPGADVAHRIRSNVPRLDAPGFLLPSRVDVATVVVRDGRSPNLEGRLVYTSNGSLVVVDPFGPAGPPIATTHPLTAGAVLIGVTADGAAFVQTGDGLSIVEDTATPTAPKTLGATGCLEPSAISYDVASPLWSDGAEKQRGIVLPRDTQARVMPDGDLKFPVGTVAIKTFSRNGKKIETRLFVQHALEDWVGYSYAWNAAGTDADLVVGNKVGGDWYFPSSSDCNACHTAAAGFTLGLEARQLDDAAKAKLAPSHSSPRFAPTDARAYLHSNCSVCHREGNATGSANLDLRFDTPLDKTGVCGEAKVGFSGARIVVPGAPERSVLVQRMRALDETRMPKLASRVVDEAGVALVEGWIRSLTSCP